MLAFVKHGPTYVTTEARSMVLGALALATYGVVSMAVVCEPHVKPWLAALVLVAATVAWLIVSVVLWNAMVARRGEND